MPADTRLNHGETGRLLLGAKFRVNPDYYKDKSKVYQKRYNQSNRISRAGYRCFREHRGRHNNNEQKTDGPAIYIFVGKI